MGTAVSDTGPINYLVTIEHLGILPVLFDAVTIPKTVEAELLEAPDAVKSLVTSPLPWLRTHQANPAEVLVESLGDGERDAIILATTLNADMVLMDDRAGVKVARSKGLTVTGTLGLLILGARRGLLDLDDAFGRLRETNFRYRPDLLDQLLAAHNARSRS